MNRTKFLAVFFSALAFMSLVMTVFMTTCDMTYISDKLKESGDREISQAERDELERTGHFLKLTFMPLHTQNANIASASVANAAASIARLSQDDKVRIFRETDTATIYLPITYNDGSEFTENGSFYVAFAIHVDAITSYVVTPTDKILVPFTDGRGELDVRTLPVFGQGNSTPELSENERNELEHTGHFLKLTFMPLHTQNANVVSVQIANSSSSIAALDKNHAVQIFKEKDFATVYIPLVYSDNSEFIENGSFFVAFAIHVDAITSYVVTLTDKILVPFTDGRGELDIRMLPYGGNVAADRRYLTIFNLPLYLLPQNVTNISVNNRYGPVAQCEDYSLVDVSTFGGSCTVSIPLSFVNSPNLAFSGTGSFYVAFDLFIDALTHYKVTEKDRVLVYFLDGNGYLDINDLPVATTDHRYLTITNLPDNLLAQNISNVTIRNQSANVAQCEDYNLLEISVSGGKASVRIPLSFINITPASVFTGTGNFIVTFNINIDANTYYIVTTDDKVQVSFNNGNGTLNILNIPEKPIPYLTIRGLPINFTKQQISNVNVYNLVGSVASCNTNNDIVILKENGYSVAKIPLSSNGGYFQNTGLYYISFTVNVDIENQIIISRDDTVALNFVGGSAVFDIFSTYGFFAADLANPSDTAKPIIKSGAEFDVDGYRHKISSNLTVPANPPAAYSGILYLYTFRTGTEVSYEFSSVNPTFNPAKNGFYNGFKRALWKMVYIDEGNQYLFKTYVADNFFQFEHTVISNASYDLLTASKSPHYSLSGAANPAATTITLPPGVYVTKLNGAGGGAGYGSSGGDGGAIIEIMTLDATTSFSAFTGSGGYAAATPSSSGTFFLYGYKNKVSGNPPSYSTSRTNDIVTIISRDAASGGGGGGGGSGTFLYADAPAGSQGYFLCAGGGGGGSGSSSFSPGGGGGSGGSIGPGSGGGAAGYFQQFYDSTLCMTATGGNGGNGGGLGGGSGGQCTDLTSSFDGSAGIALLSSNGVSPGGTASASYYQASDLSSIPSSRIGFFGTLANGNTFSEVSTFKLISEVVNMSCSASTSSGFGGSTETVNYASGPNAWRNTVNVNGTGASSPGLRSVSFSGSFSAVTEIDTRVFDVITFFFDTYTSTVSMSLSTSGYEGEAGGNNRNDARGGGAPGFYNSNGSAGSITIYKIY